MTGFVQSERLRSLPPYIFSEINAIKADAERRGISLLSLGIGDPDRPTPPEIVRKLQEAVAKPQNHVYSPYEGTVAFRRAVAEWFRGRFGVELDPMKEIVALIGSKEGIAHFPVAFCNPGDVCLYPSPGYPIFSTALQLVGARAMGVPLRAENGFLPDLAELESLMVRHRPKYLLLNFPSNPTSVTCPKALLTDIVTLARKHHVILGYDNAYSEMYFDDKDKPCSILEIPGAREVTVEFHSFSKTFNMTGWRIAFAAGNSDLVAGLLRAKTNIDSGPLLAVQEAAVFALQNAATLVPSIRDVYRERRRIMLEGLAKRNIETVPTNATFFVWARVPGGEKSMDFTKGLIEKQGLVVTPGVGFGQEGEYFFRLSLTVDVPAIQDALGRLERYLSGNKNQ